MEINIFKNISFLILLVGIVWTVNVIEHFEGMQKISKDA